MDRTHSLGELELLVLLAVARLASGAYGVPIAREIEGATARYVALGSVYAALERLEKRGLVRSELGEATKERGGRAKRYFRITAKGIRAARSLRESLVRMWNGIPCLA
jgi:PadR family transcriptional regulator, regulatory protein PadR